MPSTINGVGTWYYGRNNIHASTATCQFCGKTAMLTSYDTTLYFVVLHLPLIPLGRKRIMSQCASCSRHMVLALKRYEELRAADIDSSLKAYCEDVGSEAKAVDLVSMAIAYRSEKQFMGVAALLQQSLPENAKVLALMASAYEFFGHRDQAEPLYRKSLQIEANQGRAESYAILLLRLGRVDEARTLLQPTLDSPTMENRGLIYLLVEGLQAAGRHREAFELMEDIGQKAPALAADKEYRKYLKGARKRIHTSKPLKSAVLSRQTSYTREGSPWARRAPMLITAGVVLFIVILIIVTSRS